MKEIKLTKNKVALVDDADFTWLNQWKWCALEVDGRFYAYRTENEKGILMHRQILGFPRNHVDHKNGDTLDCQRHNLRPATNQQNCFNARKSKNNTSGFKGVYLCRGLNNPWRARIQFNGSYIHLGYFSSPAKAALAYDAAAEKYFGEFAFLNFPNNKAHKPSTVKN